jgi:hypothetical protein
MQRTMINLSEQDNQWLNRQAKLQKVPKTELVRQAIRSYKESQHVGQELSLASLLEKTSDILNIKDGLKYQQKIRADWEK